MTVPPQRTSNDSTLLIHEPCAALRPFVTRILVVEYRSAHRDVHLPGTGLIAAFRLRGTCVLDATMQAPEAALSGLWQKARHHEHSTGHAVVVVHFTPVGAAAVLRQPLDRFADSTVPLGDVLGSAGHVHLLHERLMAAPDHGQRIRVLERFLVDRVAGTSLDPLISAAVAWLHQAPASARIETLVRHIGLSERALERRFRQHVGTSPRKFASLVRLGRVECLRRAALDFTTIAHAAGYFDQAHFNKDFKRFAGVAPGAYFGAVGC